jgi:hypothetical protein
MCDKSEHQRTLFYQTTFKETSQTSKTIRMKTKRAQKLSPEEIQDIRNEVRDSIYVGRQSQITSLEVFAESNDYELYHAHSILRNLGVLDAMGRPTKQYDQDGFFEPALVQFCTNSDNKAVYRYESYLTRRGVVFLDTLLTRVGCLPGACINH